MVKVSKETGRENRLYIGIFGRVNSGKSTLLNLLTGSQAAIVSPVAGTTTDTVRKNFEITDLGAVVFLDTAGTADDSELGRARISKTVSAMELCDAAIIVYRQWDDHERKLAELLRGVDIPFLIVKNTFAEDSRISTDEFNSKIDPIEVNLEAAYGGFADDIFRRLKEIIPGNSFEAISMFGTKISGGDIVILVCPIDSEAPAGRLILPQVQAIRELLDLHSIPVVVQPDELEDVIIRNPDAVMVVTDSQVYSSVRKIVPPDKEVTTFSILLAATKGDPELYGRGLEKVDFLMDGDKILISESCSHQVSCDDIGRVKIPHWLTEYTGKELKFDIVSGHDPLPGNLAEYVLMVQCGGCMVTPNQLRRRIRRAASAGLAVTNYGMLIKKITE